MGFDFGASARTLANGRVAISSEQRMRFTALSFGWRMQDQALACEWLDLGPGITFSTIFSILRFSFGFGLRQIAPSNYSLSILIAR